jgi:hypothetical protein
MTESGKLLGEYLREVRPLARWQVVEGLRDQVIARDSGRNRLLGEILVTRGYVAPKDLEAALRRQKHDLGIAC